MLTPRRITGETIEDALHIAPRNELTLFLNRDKFDVVVITDKSSETYLENSTLQALFQAIYVTAFKKCLRQAPMLLIGGLDAWKRELGNGEVYRGLSSNGSSVPALNGGISRSSSSSSMRYTSPPYVRSRSGTESSLSSSLTNTELELGILNDGSRLPPSAENSPGPSYPLSQSSEGINNFWIDPKLSNCPVTVNGRPPSSNRVDLVCTQPLSCLNSLLRLV